MCEDALHWIIGSSHRLTSTLASTIPHSSVSTYEFEVGSAESVERLCYREPFAVADVEAIADGGLEAVDNSFSVLQSTRAGGAVLIYALHLDDLVHAYGELSTDGYRKCVSLCTVAPQLIGNSFAEALRGTGLWASMVFAYVDSPHIQTPLAIPFTTGHVALEAWSASVTLEQRRRSRPVSAVALQASDGGSVDSPAMQQMARRLWSALAERTEGRRPS